MDSDETIDASEAPSCTGCGKLLAADTKELQCEECLANAATIAGDSPSHTEPSKIDSFAGTSIGPYEIQSKLGSGGMGAVYLAEQSHPVKRMVALKLLREGFDSEELLARFEAEEQALAIMEHPNIAKVYDAGVTEDGRPFFAMEWVRGEPVNEYCDRKRLGVRERIELFLRICDGIQHAHEKGVIHRDIKPSNLLVTEVDGEPVPKIIDFGVAKALGDPLANATIATLDGQMVGTPLYMSPEQAEGRSREVDVRSDVFSLGVVLYELLTGATPISNEEFRDVGLFAMAELIRESEPRRPSTKISTLGEAATTIAESRATEPSRLSRYLRSDLDWIVLRALEPERARRYPGAGQFAADLKRHLNHEPVEASPPSVTYRVRKFAARHRAFFAGAIAVSLALILGIVAATWQAYRATRSEKIAKIQTQSARARNLVETDPAAALQLSLDAAKQDQQLREGLVTTSVLSDLLHVLEGAREFERQPTSEDRLIAVSEDSSLVATVERNRIRFSDRRNGIYRQLSPLPPEENITALCFLDSDLLLGTEEGDVYRISSQRAAPLWKTKVHEGPVASVAIRREASQLLVTAGNDQRIRFCTENGAVAEDPPIDLGEELTSLARTSLSRRGTRMVAMSDPLMGESKVLLIDLNRRVVRSLENPSLRTVKDVAFTNDDEQFVTLDSDGIIRRWNWAGGPMGSFPVSRASELISMAHHPVEPLVFLGYADGQIHVRDWRGGEAMPTLLGHRGGISGLAFSPSGACLFSLSGDQTTRTWDLLGIQALPPLALGEKTESVLVSPDGKLLAAGCVSGRVRVFDLQDQSEVETDFQLNTSCEGLANIPNGDRYVAVSILDGEIAFLQWPAEEWAARMTVPGGKSSPPAIHPSGEECVVVGGDDEGSFLYRISLTSDSPKASRIPLPGSFHLSMHASLAFSENGDHLFVRSDQGLFSFDWGDRNVPEVVASQHGMTGTGQHLFGFRSVPESGLLLAGFPVAKATTRFDFLTIPTLERQPGFLSLEANLDDVFVSRSGRFFGLVNKQSGISFCDGSGTSLGPGWRGNYLGNRTRTHAWHPDGDWVCLPALESTIRFWRFGEKDWLELAEWRKQSDDKKSSFARTELPWKVILPPLVGKSENDTGSPDENAFSLGIPGVSFSAPEGWNLMNPAMLAIFSKLAESFLGAEFQRGRVLGGHSGPIKEGQNLWERPVVCAAITDEFRGDSITDAVDRVVGLFRGRASTMAARSSAITRAHFNPPEWIDSLAMLRGSAAIAFGQESFEMRYYALPTRSHLVMFVALGGEETWPAIESAFARLEISPESRMPEAFYKEAPQLVAEALSKDPRRSNSAAVAKEFESHLDAADESARKGTPEDALEHIRAALASARPFGVTGEQVPFWVRRESSTIMRLAKNPLTPAAEKRRALLEHMENLSSLPVDFSDPDQQLALFHIEAHRILSEIAEKADEHEKALEHAEKALEAAENFSENTASASHIDRVAALHKLHGHRLSRLGRKEEAARAFRRGIDVLNQLPAEVYGARWAAVLSDLYEAIWQIAPDTNETEDREGISREWLKLAEEFFPGASGEHGRSDLWRLVKARTKLADALDKQKIENCDEAIELRRDALKIMLELDKEDPLTEGSRGTLKSTAMGLADLESKRAERWAQEKRTKEARKEFDQAISHSEMALRYREEFGTIGNLSTIYARRASFLAKEKDFDQAVKDRRASADLRKRIYQSEPTPSRKREWLLKRKDLSLALRDADRLDEAASEVEETLKGLREIFESSSDPELKLGTARDFCGICYTAITIANKIGNEKRSQQLVEERGEVATGYLAGSGDKGTVVQYTYAMSNYLGYRRQQKLGSSAELASDYRAVIAEVEPFRDSLDDNILRTVTGMEKAMAELERQSEEETGNSEKTAQ